MLLTIEILLFSGHHALFRLCFEAIGVTVRMRRLYILQ